MLGEAHRRRSRGTDVVVGLVETHGRRDTAEQLEGLEGLPRREVPHRGGTRTELDVDAVLTRHPEVVVDELAYTNAPGSRNPERWQDVDEILGAGIDVLSTVDVQDLESLPGVVARRADRIELVDTTPDALLRPRAGHPRR
jgi:two-component system sensor histidine kinase KdpD